MFLQSQGVEAARISACCYHVCPSNHLLIQSNNRNNRKRCEICLKLIIKKPDRRQWPHSGVFVVNFE